MLRLLLLPALLLISALSAAAQPAAPPSRAIENVATFARLYGYVRYFHPSDEAAAVDWDRLAVYGCQRVEAAQTDAELRQALLSVFRPVAPTLQLVPAGQRVKFKAQTIAPPDPKGYQVISWQHRGIGQGNPNNVYRSIRLNRPAPLPADQLNGRQAAAGSDAAARSIARPLFDRRAAIGEAVQEDLGSGLRCVLPLALYGTPQATWPAADSAARRALQTQLAALTPQELSSANRALRLADVVISWNVFQHFYPYFARIPTDWPATLPDALRAAYPAQSEAEYLQALRRFTAQLHDGHVNVVPTGSNRSSYFARFRLPLSWEWLQDQLVVTQVWGDSLALRPGDVVTSINGQSAAAYFHAAQAYISAATPGWLHYRTANEMLLGPMSQQLHLQVQDAQGKLRPLTLSYSVAPNALRPNGPLAPAQLLAPAVYYLNLDQLPMDSITRLLPRLAQARAIVCDLRGYPKANHALLRHLLTRPDTAGHWMRVPHLIYPNQQRVAGYYYEGWQMTPAAPHLAARVIFLTDGRAISYSESVLGMVKGCHLGTIVGQPTAGTNGNVNPLALPGPYTVYWTGMEVRRHDGAPHHGVGVQPDVYVAKTIRGVREGRDELLEKALELATAP